MGDPSSSSSSGERQKWYKRFLSSRSPPFSRRISSDCVSEGFALIIPTIHLDQLQTGRHYYVSVYFYDGVRNEFFGRDIRSQSIEAHNHSLILNQEIFFHAPVIQGVHIVIELVSHSEDNVDDLLTVAWTVLALGDKGSALAYYAQHSHVATSKLKLYPGSPMFLLVSKSLNDIIGLQGTAEVLLLCHPPLRNVSDFFPEYFLVNKNDDVPGIIPGGLGTGKGEPRVMANIDGIGLTFQEGNDKIEDEIEQLLTQEWMTKINEVKQTEKMEILERRLRIGVHNGLGYLCEPLTVHLIPRQDALCGTQTLRRKGRSCSLTRNESKKTSPHELVVRSRLSLPIVKDPRFAIVFSIDYLIGVRMKDEIKNAQSVLIGWGIALPFSSSPNSFHLIGGPRPNPEEILSFKSLYSLSTHTSSSLPSDHSSISLSFNFFLLDEDSSSPLPFRPSIPPRVQVEDEDEEEIDGRETQIELSPPTKHSQMEEVQKEEEETEPEEMKPENRGRREGRERRRDHLVIKQPQLSPIGMRQEEVYEEPTRISFPIARSSLAFLSSIKFSPIVDRNGDIPLLVDGGDKRPVDMTIEKHDRLASNEVVVQLLACKWNMADSPIHRVFFTMQFFRFPQVTTESLQVSQDDISVLKRLHPDQTGKLPPGFTSKFIVDRSTLNTTHELAVFLATRSLLIEVWDASSLLLLGSVSIPLRSLCRRGVESVQFYMEAPIIQSSLNENPFPIGHLYVRMANIGHPFSNQIERLHSSNHAIISHSLSGLSSLPPNSEMIVRPQPLSASANSTLHRFLQSQRIDLHRRYAEMFNEKSLHSIRQWEELKKKIPGSAHHEATLKRFIFEEELEAYRKVRREGKASRLLAAVFKGLTVSHSLSLSVGEVSLFEFLLTNPYPHAVNCTIQMDDICLSVVTQSDEWMSWRRHSSNRISPVEANLFEPSKGTRDVIFLRPNESLLIPFKYDALRATSSREEGSPVESKVLFKGVQSGEPLSILDLLIDVRPYALDKLFRFMADQMINFEKTIRINEKNRVMACRCSDPSVKTSLVQGRGGIQYLRFTVYTGPSGSVRTMIVFLYEDEFCHRMVATWKIVLHSLTRLDVHSIQGQTSNITLPLPSDIQESSSLTIHSSSPTISLPHPQPIHVTPSTQIRVTFTPNFIGSRILLLSIVDNDYLLVAYSLHATVTEPHISSSFHLKLSSSTTETVIKRIPLSNSYSIPRTFRLVSSHPLLMSPLSPLIDLPPMATSSPPLQFHPVNFHSKTVHMFLFIQNAETGQEEETYDLTVSYSHQ